MQCLAGTFNVIGLPVQEPNADSSLQLLDFQQLFFVDVLEVELSSNSQQVLLLLEVFVPPVFYGGGVVKVGLAYF